MAEHLFIKKRQKDRRKHTFLTVKLILRLVIASALLLLGFHYFVGDPSDGLCAAGGCESEYSLATYVFAALIMLGGVIVLGGLTGALIAYLRRNRQSDSMFSLIDQQETPDKPNDQQ